MGPRPIGRGNIPVAGSGESRRIELQWGRDQLVAEIPDRGHGAVAYQQLQWGRDQLVAEMWDLAMRHAHQWLASMGPRPIGRGNIRLERLGDAVADRLQWGRDQLVAEIWRGSAENQMCSSRFNGAATNWSRKSRARLHNGELRGAASMGPRPIGRGNAPAAGAVSLGAALQWGRDQLVAEMRYW